MSDVSATPQLVEDFTLVFSDASTALPPWFWPAASAFLLVAGAAGFWSWRRRRAARLARRAAIAGFLDGPPEAWALRRLADLQAGTETLPAHSFALEVSEIIRVFLERRFDLRAAHQSTEEFLGDAREGTALSPVQQERLREFLSCCDEAKFARRALVLEKKRELLASAVSLVKETASQPAPLRPRPVRTHEPACDPRGPAARASAA
ncbi:MAG TPA: hypothetical protein VGD81_18730 [Opitutaceae bacterium]